MMECWGHGASAVGRRFRYDRETCDSCGAAVSRSSLPFYFDGEPTPRTLCISCARGRHSGCPCGFVEVAA